MNLIALDGEDAISTSGSYQRYYDWEGGRYHHTRRALAVCACYMNKAHIAMRIAAKR